MRHTLALALALLCPALTAQTPPVQPASASTPPPAMADAAQLPPSEELKAAAQPLIAARSQPNDLTQADLLAYTVGVGRAGQACHRLEPQIEELAARPDELLSLGRLCDYGLQYQVAQKAIWRYLKLPAPPDRETALLVLTKAFLGLQDPLNAALQIQAIERDFPYDAQIHLAIEQDVQLGALLGDEPNAQVLNLCADALKNTLPLLETGHALESKEGTIAPSTLFNDAVRCVDTARDLINPTAGEMLIDAMARLQAILDRPTWQHTAEYAPMQAALARTLQSNQPTPIPALTGKLLHGLSPQRPFTLPLDHGTVLLVPFTLWSPSVLSTIPELHATAPNQEIYLVTSYAANSGASDDEDKELLDSLRTTAKALPERASILIVPDSALQRFFADTFPAAVVLRGGRVEANLPLMGEAGKRMTIFALHLPENAPAAQVDSAKVADKAKRSAAAN
ncbi:MAG TPA: hypothetical protein VIM62_01880 [Acidobacteriaceae bacterium]